MEIIHLSKALLTGEGTVRALRMRRPTPRDYAEVGQFGGDDLMRGIALVARICGLSISEFERLAVSDFKAVMAQFKTFTGGAHS